MAIYELDPLLKSYRWTSTGGTSMAAPLVAGIVADTQQGRTRPFGFLNPLLYQLAGTTALHDVLPLDSTTRPPAAACGASRRNALPPKRTPGSARSPPACCYLPAAPATPVSCGTSGSASSAFTSQAAVAGLPGALGGPPVVGHFSDLVLDGFFGNMNPAQVAVACDLHAHERAEGMLVDAVVSVTHDGVVDIP